MKICQKCNIEKPAEDYSTRKGRLTPYTQCDSCRKEIMRLYRIENKYKMEILWKNYRIIHRDKIREKNRLRAIEDRKKESVQKSTARYRASEKCRVTKRIYAKKLFAIGDYVYFGDHKYQIKSITTHGHSISRLGLPPIRVPKRKLRKIIPNPLSIG